MIILFAFGKRGYGMMCGNLVLSLKKYSPDVPIHVWTTPELQKYIPNVVEWHILEENEWKGNHTDPAKIKTKIYQYGKEAGLEKMLYLDVDAIAMQPIEPLLKALEGTQVATEVLGYGQKHDKITYCNWATRDNIYKEFGLHDEAYVCGIQSSWAYFEVGKVCDTIQAHLDYHMAKGIPPHLYTSWGGTLPDELIYTGVYAKLGIIPKYPDMEIKPMFFGVKSEKTQIKDVQKDYHILSIYGKEGMHTVRKWLRMYDQEALKCQCHYLTQDFTKDKHVGF